MWEATHTNNTGSHQLRVQDLYRGLPACTTLCIPSTQQRRPHSGGFPLLDLPVDVLGLVVQHCAACNNTLRAVQRTCRVLQALASTVVHGLRLELYSHQVGFGWLQS